MAESQRKSPVQQRSQQTVATLLDAAAQVLQVDGEDGFTTNRVAEKAGFSIGTLYQYFPNKTALVEALVARERGAMEAAITHALSTAGGGELEKIVRLVVRTVIRAFGRRRRARRLLILHLVRGSDRAMALNNMDKIGRMVAQAIAERGGSRVRQLSEAGAFVLTRSIIGTIRAAVLEDKAILETPEFEDEVVLLALRFLQPA